MDGAQFGGVLCTRCACGTSVAMVPGYLWGWASCSADRNIKAKINKEGIW